MLEIADYGNINVMFNFKNIPEKCNKMWGTEYLLMDCNAFMGGGTAQYDAVVDIFVNIWNANNQKQAALPF